LKIALYSYIVTLWEVEQMMTRLLAEIKSMQEKMDAKNESFEVLRDILVSRMDAHQP
jgi:hypothetical protein